MCARHRLLNSALATVLLLSLLLSGSVGAMEATPTIVASGLANPRGLVVTDDGTLFVAEAGLSGSENFTPAPPHPPSTRGTSGRGSRIGPGGARTTVAGNLPSLSLGGNANAFVVGPAGLVMAGDALWLATGAMINGFPPAPNAASVLRIEPRTGAVSLVADLGAYERANNPDGLELSSNPHGLALGTDGNLYLADAAGNALYRLNPGTGELALVTVFAGLPGAAANPQRGGKSERDPAPTGVAVGADGSIYVGLLGGSPFPPGGAKVVRVAPDGTVGDVVSGLTAVVSLAVGPDRLLYVVEFGSFNRTSQPPSWNPNSGRILRVLADGTTQVVADGLNLPQGSTFDKVGNLYLAVNSSTSPQAGAQGQILRFDGVAAPAPGLPSTGAGGGRQAPALLVALLGLATSCAAGLLLVRRRHRVTLAAGSGR